MKNQYISLFLLLFYNYGSNNNTNQKNEFSYKPVQLAVLIKYSIKLGSEKFYKKKNVDLSHLIYLITLANGNIVGKNLLLFIEQYITYFTKDNKYNDNENDSNQELKSTLQQFMCYVNYDGVNNLKPLIDDYNQNNSLLQYEIIPLRITNINEAQEIEKVIGSRQQERNLEKFCMDYSLLPNVTLAQNPHQLMTKCKNCSKKEIREVLQSMKINQSKIVYLHSRKRYVYIKLLKIVPFSSISQDAVNYIYLKNGLSLLKNNPNAQQKYAIQLLHNFFCTH